MTRPRAPWRPPPRDGVSASRVAVGDGSWPDMLSFLNARLPAGADWRVRLARDEVLDAQGRSVAADTPARRGDVLWYWREPPPETRVPFEVELLHQDEEIVVVDKPHFLSVTPGGRHLHETVLVRLKKALGIEALSPVHRLDRETAGVLLFTAQERVRHAYHELMRQQRVHKVYEAVAPWRAELQLPLTHRSRLQTQDDDRFMQMLTVPGAANTVTQIELIRRLPTSTVSPWPDEPVETAHYRLTPLTGRKHQLRVHMLELGIPILGDRIYPRLWPEDAEGTAPDFSCPLQLLARELSFDDPFTGQRRRFASRRVLERAVQRERAAEAPATPGSQD